MTTIRSKMVTCKICQGTGGDSGAACLRCKGVGKVVIRVQPEVQSDRRCFFRGALITNYRQQKVK